jgi:hypothetical protein
MAKPTARERNLALVAGAVALVLVALGWLSAHDRPRPIVCREQLQVTFQDVGFGAYRIDFTADDYSAHCYLANTGHLPVSFMCEERVMMEYSSPTTYVIIPTKSASVTIRIARDGMPAVEHIVHPTYPTQTGIAGDTCAKARVYISLLANRPGNSGESSR